MSNLIVIKVLETILMIIGTLVIIGVIYSILMKDSLNKLFNRFKKRFQESPESESVIASLAFSILATDDNAITPGRSLVPVTGKYADGLENYDTTQLKGSSVDTKLYPLF